MLKILFVDDEANRLALLQMREFFFEGTQVTAATNALEAIEALKNDTFDMVFLDHDLNTFQDGKEITGLDVVKYMVDHLTTSPSCVVHSMNHAAAWRMSETLKENDFYVQVVPFHKLPQRMYYNVVEMGVSGSINHRSHLSPRGMASIF